MDSLRKIELIEFGKGDNGKCIVRADAIVAIESNDGKATIITLKTTHKVEETYASSRDKWRKAIEKYDASA